MAVGDSKGCVHSLKLSPNLRQKTKVIAEKKHESQSRKGESKKQNKNAKKAKAGRKKVKAEKVKAKNKQKMQKR